MKTTTLNQTAPAAAIEVAAQQINAIVSSIQPARSKSSENFRDIAAESFYIALALEATETLKGDAVDEFGRFYEEMRIAKEVLSKVPRLSVAGVARQGGFKPEDNKKIVSATARAVQFIKNLSATQTDMAF